MVLPPAWAMRRPIGLSPAKRPLAMAWLMMNTFGEVRAWPVLKARPLSTWVPAVVQLVESAHEEGGAREQDHGEGELADDEDVAEASMAAISGSAARTALESAVQIEPEGEQRGGNAEGEGRQETGAERPAEHVPVERENDAYAIVSCAGNSQPVEGPHGRQNGTDAAGEGQQEGLDEQGAQHLGARGTEGGAHGELASAGHRAGEEKVRQIGAGDEQHEAG